MLSFLQKLMNLSKLIERHNVFFPVLHPRLEPQELHLPALAFLKKLNNVKTT